MLLLYALCCARTPFLIINLSCASLQFSWLKGDVPALGGDDASHEEVMAFYNFWYAAKSWRDFGYYDEEDPSQAESREEKRYIERFNRFG